MRYNVYSQDVWGHHPSECCPGYGCRCVHRTFAADDDNGTYTHDDDRCDCSYQVNDRARVGAVDIEDLNAGILSALDSGGFIHASLCEVDDVSDDECIYIVSKDLGRPLLYLEVES